MHSRSQIVSKAFFLTAFKVNHQKKFDLIECCFLSLVIFKDKNQFSTGLELEFQTAQQFLGSIFHLTIQYLLEMLLHKPVIIFTCYQAQVAEMSLTEVIGLT